MSVRLHIADYRTPAQKLRAAMPFACEGRDSID